MFDNKFLKHDPLVEAVKQAQADGEMRRQAEAIVNEAFGVYSRNAVVREDLEGYDISVEAVYADLREGKWEGSKEDRDEDAKLAKKHGMTIKQWEKSAADKKHDAKEKMDEAKLAKKDYDKDGKIESPKDEVWGSRFRAAKAAGKMEEGAVDAGSYEGSKSVTKSAPKEDPSLPKSYPGAASSAPTAQRLSNAKAAIRENQIEEERKRTASVADAFMKGQKANQRTLRTDGKTVTYHGNTIAKHEGDEVHVTTAGHSHSPSTRGHINGILSRLGSEKLSVKKGQLHHGKNPVDHDAWIKVKKSTVSEEQIDEVSKRAAISAYREKEAQDRGTTKLRGLIRKKWGEKTVKHAERAGASDTGNLVRKGQSHGTDYLSRATPSSEMRKTASGKIHKQDVESKKSEMKFRKSMSKFDKPRGHLPEEHIDEAAYSAKSARAGKDIGKPGKMFAQIAAKAGSKYGSEERGKKVAGAILKKIRAKHMKEEQIEEIVQKSQIRPGETLGQAMNRLSGKTAIKGGANDPTSSKFKGPSSSTSSTQWKAPAPVDQASTIKASGGTPTTTNAPLPPSRPASLGGSKPDLPRIDDAPKVPAAGMPNPKVNVPTPPVRTAAPAPAPMQNPDQARTKVMKEEVQIGDYKYRIV